MNLFALSSKPASLRRCRWILSALAAVVVAHAAVPSGTSLLPGGLGDLRFFGGDEAARVVQRVPVTGQPFAEALRVDTFERTRQGDAGLAARIPVGVRKGDVLWISFRARALETRRETGAAHFELRFDQLVDGKYRWPSHLERGISVGAEWTETSVPFAMTKDAGPDEVRLVIEFDSYPQRFELGPVTFINCGPEVKLADLPRSVVRYGGDEPDAPWRRAAAERIERHRQGDLTVLVRDAAGRPVPDATVSIRMKRLDFAIGTATASWRLLDTADPDSKRYREVLLKYFNQVVFDNEMKWPRWADPKHDPANTLKALDWLAAHDLPARGHVMVWPSWRHLPAFMSAQNDQPAALRAATLAHIERQTRIMRGRFAEWDVTNELYAHHDLLDAVGWDELANWYRAAHAGEPAAKLYCNEYTMFHADGPDSPAEHFYRTVKSLLERDAPVHGIGEQAHIGGTPPAIPLVLERLDRFAQLGLPIAITEFDINSNDDDFKARYLRDFMTAVFSHPATVGITQWGFWEAQHWFPVAALWNKDWTLRKHGEAFVDLVTREWRTDHDGPTDEAGRCRVRAFCGDYLVEVRHAGGTQIRSCTVPKAGVTVEMRL